MSRLFLLAITFVGLSAGDVLCAQMQKRDFPLADKSEKTTGLFPLDGRVAKFVDYGSRGLRIECTPEKTQKGDIGLRVGVRLTGDFEFHAGVTDIEIDKPSDWSVGPFLRIELEGEQPQTHSLYAFRSGNGKLRLMRRCQYPGSDQKDLWWGRDLTEAPIELRLNRLGSQLTFEAKMRDDSILMLQELEVPTVACRFPTIGMAPGNNAVRGTCTFSNISLSAATIEEISHASPPAKVAARVLEPLEPQFASEPDELIVDFRTNEFDFRKFEVNGNNALPLVRPTEQGLMTVLPGGAKGLSSVAVKSRFGIVGDFELTATFSEFEADRPDEGTAYNFIQLFFPPEKKSRAVLSRSTKTGRGEAFVSSFQSPPKNAEDEPKTQWGECEAKAKAGRLRIVRRGDELAYMVADGYSDKFQTIQRVACESDMSVTHFLMGVGVWKADVPVRCHWTNLTLKAFDITLPGETHVAKQSPFWLLLGIISAAVATGVLVTIAWWRKRGESKTAGTVKTRAKMGERGK